jgi:Flp pilus assembly pilin Flp
MAAGGGRELGMALRLSQALYRDESGAGLVEYILLAMLIGLAAIAGTAFIGKAADNQLNNITLQSQPT